MKDDAKTYAEQKKKLAESQAEQEKATTLIGMITQYSQDILHACPDWTANSISQAYSCSNINTEWTNLLSKVTSLVSKLQDCNTTITNSEKDLAAYYQESGKTEQTLKSLVAQEQQVTAARKLVSETDALLKSRNDAITEAQRQIDVAFKELSISDRSEVPDKQIPPLVLISFIENAFKHGISYQHESFVEMKVTVEVERLSFTCRNSKAEVSNEMKGGVGLTNVRKRLDLLYGQDYTLRIHDDAEVYTVELNIPL